MKCGLHRYQDIISINLDFKGFLLFVWVFTVFARCHIKIPGMPRTGDGIPFEMTRSQ